MVLSMGSEDGEVIFKDQFVHFLYLLQSALLGPRNVCAHEAGSIAELEFIQNVGYYGECSEFAFNDIMAECIGMLGGWLLLSCFVYFLASLLACFLNSVNAIPWQYF